jgi:hypothetical protein
MSLSFEVLARHEVMSRSFGLVSDPTFPCPEHWAERRHTLFEPGAFGPERDFTCACGKYQGEASLGVICDACGVRVGHSRRMRRSRFGHIFLREAVPHPLLSGTQIDILPVIPIAYRQDTGERDLDYLYSRVLRANQPPGTGALVPDDPAGNPASLADTVRELFDNESRSQPVLFRGWAVRSLRHYGFESPSTSMDDLGTFLFALMVKIVVSA